jgi:hypothetical protein
VLARERNLAIKVRSMATDMISVNPPRKLIDTKLALEGMNLVSGDFRKGSIAYIPRLDCKRYPSFKMKLA